MSNCDCTFAWHAVIPPTHCPKCGRCLGCGQPQFVPYPMPYPVYPQPLYPYPPNPWRWSAPLPTITYTTNGTTGFAA